MQGGDLGKDPTVVYARRNIKGQRRGPEGTALLHLLSGQCWGAPPGLLVQYSHRRHGEEGQAAVNNGIALPWLY